jgi:hypothetical protein
VDLADLGGFFLSNTPKFIEFLSSAFFLCLFLEIKSKIKAIFAAEIKI